MVFYSISTNSLKIIHITKLTSNNNHSIKYHFLGTTVYIKKIINFLNFSLKNLLQRILVSHYKFCTVEWQNISFYFKLIRIEVSPTMPFKNVFWFWLQLVIEKVTWYNPFLKYSPINNDRIKISFWYFLKACHIKIYFSSLPVVIENNIV